MKNLSKNELKNEETNLKTFEVLGMDHVRRTKYIVQLLNYDLRSKQDEKILRFFYYYNSQMKNLVQKINNQPINN